MSKNNQSESTTTQLLMVVCVVFIAHIALAAFVSAVGLGLYFLWKKQKMARVPIVCGLMGTLIWCWQALPDAPPGMSALHALYLVLLDHMTRYLTEFGLSGRIAFKLARFFIKLLPLSGLMAASFITWFVVKRARNSSVVKIKPLFPKLIYRSQIPKWRNDRDAVFIGVSTKGRPVYLSDYERGMHTQVIGSTGFGKTSSVVMPMLASDLKRGKSVIFIDGKGDSPSLSAFIQLVREAGREHDTYIFAPSYPNISNSWNPLASGNPVVRKDRIVGAQIWSEEFYKKKGEDLLQMVLQLFDDLKLIPSFPLLAQFLKNPNNDCFKNLVFPNQKIEDDYNEIKKLLKSEAKNYAGIIADINLFSESFLKPMLTAGKPDEINLFDAAMNGKVVYFNFPVLMMEETMKRIARMVIHDLKTVCSEIQNYVDVKSRKSISVLIDEFGSFASESFIELLNKARSAGVGITLIHQSLGDIEGVDKNFARQIYENTNIKIVLRVDDPATIEQFCRMAGTHQEKKFTYQTDLGILGQSASGAASMREVDVFNVDPNVFRRLGIGEAVIMVKSKSEYHTVKLDYIDPPKIDLSACAAEARKIVIEGIVPDTEQSVQMELIPKIEEVVAKPAEISPIQKLKRKPKKFPIKEVVHEST